MKAATDNVVPLSTLCSAPFLYEGMSLKTSGTVSYVGDQENFTYIYLEDSSDNWTYSLYCVSDNDLDVVTGQRYWVTGEFEYDPLRARYKLTDTTLVE